MVDTLNRTLNANNPRRDSQIRIHEKLKEQWILTPPIWAWEPTPYGLFQSDIPNLGFIRDCQGIQIEPSGYPSTKDHNSPIHVFSQDTGEDLGITVEPQRSVTRGHLRCVETVVTPHVIVNDTHIRIAGDARRPIRLGMFYAEENDVVQIDLDFNHPAVRQGIMSFNLDSAGETYNLFDIDYTISPFGVGRVGSEDYIVNSDVTNTSGPGKYVSVLFKAPKLGTFTLWWTPNTVSPVPEAIYNLKHYAFQKTPVLVTGVPTLPYTTTHITESIRANEDIYLYVKQANLNTLNERGTLILDAMHFMDLTASSIADSLWTFTSPDDQNKHGFKLVREHANYRWVGYDAFGKTPLCYLQDAQTGWTGKGSFRFSVSWDMGQGWVQFSVNGFTGERAYVNNQAPLDITGIRIGCSESSRMVMKRMVVLPRYVDMTGK